MKPAYGRYQAATKVNVLSPEIVVIKKADSIHKLEGNMAMNVTGEFRESPGRVSTMNFKFWEKN